MSGTSQHATAAILAGEHQRQRLQERSVNSTLPTEPRVQAVLRPYGRTMVVSVAFDASVGQWKIGTRNPLGQIARLRSPDFVLNISGTQYAIQGLRLGSENDRPVYFHTGPLTKLTLRNTFRSGDLTQLYLSKDDVFHIQNLQEYLLHVNEHGVGPTAAASRGGSMKAWLLTGSDFERIDRPEVMQKCKAAFEKLFREGFVSTVFLDIRADDQTYGPETYDQRVITTMGSRPLARLSHANLHPVVRSAMDFFQGIWPGVPENYANCVDLQFLWTFEYIEAHNVGRYFSVFIHSYPTCFCRDCQRQRAPRPVPSIISQTSGQEQPLHQNPGLNTGNSPILAPTRHLDSINNVGSTAPVSPTLGQPLVQNQGQSSSESQPLVESQPSSQAPTPSSSNSSTRAQALAPSSPARNAARERVVPVLHISTGPTGAYPTD